MMASTFKFSHFAWVLFIIILIEFIIICDCHSPEIDLDHHHHHQHHQHHHHNDEPPAFKYSKEANVQYSQKSESDVKAKFVKQSLFDLWLSAFGSTILISGAPFIILFFIPLSNSNEHQPLLKVLLSFASGGLLGDAFLHLIPHALLATQAAHEHSHHHNRASDEPHEHDMSVGISVLAGILAFLVVEKFVRIIKGPGHGHSHNLTEEVNSMLTSKEKVLNENKKNETEDNKTNNKSKKTDRNSLENIGEAAKEEDSHLIKRVRFAEKPKIMFESLNIKNDSDDIKVSAYLNLAADFAHNLTDGLAIGASFLAGKNIGIVTTLTILFHEIPHEIGDFAILIQSGCSKKKAIYLQLVTAFGALTGCFISLLADGMTDTAAPWILPFTAGGFIYIATVSVIPELLEGTSVKQSIQEILALIFGVVLMIVIAQYE